MVRRKRESAARVHSRGLRKLRGNFGKIWDASMKLGVKRRWEGAVRDGLVPAESAHDRELRRQFEILDRKAYEALNLERKKIQAAIAEMLFDVLPDDEHLLDLMSGVPTSVLPLVGAGKVSQLTLVDNCADPSLAEHRRTLVDRFGGNVVRDLNLNLDGSSFDLPETSSVTLVETGFTLPFHARGSQELVRAVVEDEEPKAFRSGHVQHDLSIQLMQILDSLGRVPGRRIWMVDTPFYTTSVSAAEIDDFVAGQLKGSSWEIEQTFESLAKTPSFHGVLIQR